MFSIIHFCYSHDELKEVFFLISIVDRNIQNADIKIQNLFLGNYLRYGNDVLLTFYFGYA